MNSDVADGAAGDEGMTDIGEDEVGLGEDAASFGEDAAHRGGPQAGVVMRVEHDSMGEVLVPARAKWRAQTQRAVENFPISGAGLERAQIAALGRIKAA